MKALAMLFAGGLTIGLILVVLFFAAMLFVFAFIVAAAVTGSTFAGIIGGVLALCFAGVMIAGALS